MTDSRSTVGLLVLSWLLVGCLSGPAPGSASSYPVETTPESGNRPTAPDAPTSSESLVVEPVALRIRAVTCAGLATGSGFAVAPHLLVTNRHVVDGASEVSVNTWDGESIAATIESVAVYTDLALVRVEEALPVVATLSQLDPEHGTSIVTMGYPSGGPLVTTHGGIVGYESSNDHGSFGPVLRFDAPIEPGSSGGPILGADASVVGVVYAKDTRNGDGLGLPVSAVHRMLERSTPSLAATFSC